MGVYHGRHLCLVGAMGVYHGMVGTSARSTRRQNGRSMPLGTLQDTGKALTRPFEHRVTHDRHNKTAKTAKKALRAQNGLSAEAPLRPNPLSMHLGHAPRCGTVCPHTLASAVTHGARRQGPKGGPTLGGYSTIKLVACILGRPCFWRFDQRQRGRERAAEGGRPATGLIFRVGSFVADIRVAGQGREGPDGA